MPTVSVIIPTYCRSSELENYLFPSLLRQSFPPSEILVVDDTPDNSVKSICDNWKMRFMDSKIPLIFKKNPLGRSVIKARKYSASVAKGEILTFFDSDITLYDDYIQKIINVFESKKDAAGVQGFIVGAFNKSKKINYVKNLRKSKNWLRYLIFLRLATNLFGASFPSFNSCKLFEYPIFIDKIISCDWLSGSNMSVKRQLFKQIQFDQLLSNYSLVDQLLSGYRLGEDVFISTSLKSFGKLYITPYAKCRHICVKSGRPDIKTLMRQEKYFYIPLLGVRGAIILFNRKLISKAHLKILL